MDLVEDHFGKAIDEATRSGWSPDAIEELRHFRSLWLGDWIVEFALRLARDVRHQAELRVVELEVMRANEYGCLWNGAKSSGGCCENPGHSRDAGFSVGWQRPGIRRRPVRWNL